MRNILILLALISMPALAGAECNTSESAAKVTETKDINTDVPKFLEGAVIVVRLANGKETTVPAERFKVVPRKQQFLITQTQVNTKVTCTSKDDRQHRISLHAGRGPKGNLDRDNVSASTVEISNNYGAIGALQYQYRFDDSRFSLSGEGVTNKSALVGIGYDF